MRAAVPAGTGRAVCAVKFRKAFVTHISGRGDCGRQSQDGGHSNCKFLHGLLRIRCLPRRSSALAYKIRSVQSRAPPFKSQFSRLLERRRKQYLSVSDQLVICGTQVEVAASHVAPSAQLMACASMCLLEQPSAIAKAGLRTRKAVANSVFIIFSSPFVAMTKK